jgi:hypothetical protein
VGRPQAGAAARLGLASVDGVGDHGVMTDYVPCPSRKGRELVPLAELEVADASSDALRQRSRGLRHLGHDTRSAP